MVLKSDKEKVKTLLSETIRLLCKNGLHFKTEFCVEALVGITLDHNEEFFLSIKETVKSDIVSSSDDLKPKPRPDPHRHERLERQEKKVKREPSNYSSCQRKRQQSDDIQVHDDNHQAGDLSLGDPQGEQSFWTALTECGNSEQIPKKRRHAEPPDEQSSHSDIRIEIKGEPESDDDIEEIDSPSHDQDQNQTIINMPEQFAFGTAGSSNPGISGTIPSSALPQQVWDQFPAMGSSDMAGPSGIQSGNTSGLDIDSQQQHPGQQPMMIKLTHQPRNGFEKIAQKILLCRGTMVTPRRINSLMRNDKTAQEIIAVMKQLFQEGLGMYDDEMQTPNSSRRRKIFVKKDSGHIMDGLKRYGVNPVAYEIMCSMEVKRI